MTFKEQTAWCRKWGAAALFLSLLLVALLYVLAGNVDRKWIDFSAFLCTAAVFMGAVLLVFGGLLRPLQKSFYHHALEGNDRYRRQMALNPMSLWVWIDTEGRDRDA
ncbi:MAG: hypothetical protein ACRC14_18295 [Paracoccaceae bacterium]